MKMKHKKDQLNDLAKKLQNSNLQKKSSKMITDKYFPELKNYTFSKMPSNLVEKKKNSSSHWTIHKQKLSKKIHPFLTLSINYFTATDKSGILIYFPASYYIFFQNETDTLHDSLYFDEISGKTPEEKSKRLLERCFDRLYYFCQKLKVKHVYYDSYDRISAMYFIRSLNSGGYQFSLIIRDNCFFEAKVYSKTIQKKTVVFKLRDYKRILDGSLQNLGNDFLTSSEKVPSEYIGSLEDTARLGEKFCKDNSSKRAKYLFEIIRTTQHFIYHEFSCDIVESLSISALSMRIFTSQFYDESENPIFINNDQKDAFIRRGYFGGHTDLYRPLGKNVYLYDINSLYNFCMLFDLPAGEGEFFQPTKNMNLSQVFGFIDADIRCPKEIQRPLLPVRHRGRLYFPTENFSGVYFSEELKLAESLGYSIKMKKILLYKKQKSPFSGFVSNLFKLRVDAKKNKRLAAAKIYKLILLSLYGRFGLKTEPTITTVVNFQDLQFYIKFYPIINYQEIAESNES